MKICSKRNTGHWLAIGIGAGAALGVALHDMAVGIGLGAGIGALWMAMAARNPPPDKD